MKLNVTPEQFEELIKRGYNLDVIFLLKLIDDRFDVSPLCDGSMKIASVYHSLIRKALITPDDEKITTLGRDLLDFMNTKSSGRIIRRKPASTDFEEWWKTYPGTDSFEYKGKKFTGTRALRLYKDDCRLKFDKIILEGEYTAQQLIAALNYEITQKKETSVATNSNRLTFMQGSSVYLNQRSFEPFIELINEGAKVDIAPQKPTGGTDIQIMETFKRKHMTPKEKAKELVDRFSYRIHIVNCFHDNKVNSKESALIAVDEIETVLLQERVFESLDYWKEVKQEIKLL